MGKYLSVLNPFRNFNIENRAHKAISQTKPSPAPKFEADQKVLDRLLKGLLGIVKEIFILTVIFFRISYCIPEQLEERSKFG